MEKASVGLLLIQHTLGDRAFLVELLPVLLLGLTDEASSIRDATMLRLKEIGEKHAAMQVSTTPQVACAFLHITHVYTYH